MTTTYTCDGFRPIRQTAEIRFAEDAARIFADRLARREFGRAGYCRTVRSDGHRMDGSSYTFEAFIGHDGEQRGQTVGHNVWLYVSVAY